MQFSIIKIKKKTFLCHGTFKHTLVLYASRCLVTKTKIKAEKKLTVEMWPYKNYRMNRLGLGICRRLLTLSCFWYLNLFWQFSMAIFTDTFPSIWDIIIMSVFFRFYFCCRLQVPECLETCVNCALRFAFFFLNLSGKIVADLYLQLHVFNVMEFCEVMILINYERFYWIRPTGPI